MISIIIIVKNDLRLLKLLDCLKSYITKEKFETLIIDASKGLFDKSKASYKFVKWISYSTNKKTSIPEQRNLGLKKAKGDIIIFIDSDCLPQKEWLENLIEPIKKEGESIVSGRILHSNERSLHSIESNRHSQRIYLGEAPTMNLAIKKEVFNKIGEFDTNFQCGEDVDLLWRATRQGYRIRYTPKAGVSHDLGSFINELRRMYRYGRARTMLYKKHTYKQKLFWGSEVGKIIYFFYLITLPLVLFYPWYSIFLIIYVIKNYKFNPLRKFLYRSFYGLGIIAELKVFAIGYKAKF